MPNKYLLPPLRLILNSDCNGKCYFCHHEGYNNTTTKNMSLHTLDQCIQFARDQKIKRISLSGGEPTLRDDLPHIILKIRQHLPDIELGLTTNGFNIFLIDLDTFNALNHINLSISSFEKEIYAKYTNIDPTKIFSYLADYCKKITINVVITNDNANEICKIVEKCIEWKFSVDLMFELLENNKFIQKSIISLLINKYGIFNIQYGSTPAMLACYKDGVAIRIKSPSCSRLVLRDICKKCKEYDSCSEKMCAIRVLPDGSVTPCLNGEITINEETTIMSLKKAYQFFDNEDTFDVFYGSLYNI